MSGRDDSSPNGPPDLWRVDPASTASFSNLLEQRHILPIVTVPPSGRRRRSRNPSKPGAYQCSTCMAKFDRQSELTKHERKHLDPDQRPHKCPQCGAGFLFPKDLRRHELSRAHGEASSRDQDSSHGQSQRIVGIPQQDRVVTSHAMDLMSISRASMRQPFTTDKMPTFHRQHDSGHSLEDALSSPHTEINQGIGAWTEFEDRGFEFGQWDMFSESPIPYYRSSHSPMWGFTTTRENRSPQVRHKMQYHYSPLRPPGIRILVVEAGDFNEKLRCELTHQRLISRNSGFDKEYEAVSYFSAHHILPDSSDSIEIVCKDSPSESQRQNVTVDPNILKMLKYLRLRTTSRALWVHDICVNKQDVDEENTQISLLPTIYAQAKRVCVWLGSDEKPGEIALRCISTYLRAPQKSLWQATSLKPDINLQNHIQRLITRPWFSSCWAVQVIAFAKAVTFHCHNYFIPLRHFETVVSLAENWRSNTIPTMALKDFARPNPVLSNAVKLFELGNSVIWNRQRSQILGYRWTMNELIHNLLTFEAENAKDRIFSVLSLAKDTHEDCGESIVIDYRMALLELCKKFLSISILQANTHANLNVLLQGQRPTKESLLPSWFPSFLEVSDLGPYHALFLQKGTHKDAEPLIGDPTGTKVVYDASRSQRAGRGDWEFRAMNNADPSLFVRAFELDTIWSIGDASQFGIVPQSWFRLAGWADWQKEAYVVPDQLWRTLVANRGPNGASVKAYYEVAFRLAMQISIDGINTVQLQMLRDPAGDPAFKEFLERVEASVWGRRFFKSSDSESLGLAPAEAREGDVIVIMKGASVPVVLRPVQNPGQSSSYYRLIGECYLHGMMDGEAFEDATDINSLFKWYELQ